MKAALTSGVVLLILFVLLVGLPVTGTSSFSTRMPVGNPSAASVQRLVRFASTHDWESELTRAGARRTARVLETIVDDLAEANAEIDRNRINYRIEYRILSPLAFGPSIGPGLEIIRHRLQAEAYLLAWNEVDETEYRRGLLWQVYGTGFDDRLRTFLDQEIPRTTDPELVRDMETMRSRLRPSNP